MLNRRRRGESILASGALLVLLVALLLYGCRAFSPEPFVFNYPPDTFIMGAPAETTGTRFLRHLYWYGVDRDGEVVRFIYAITDSSVADPSIPAEDEENQRFDPADDSRTLLDAPDRKVGWTTRSDSVFLFEVDRGEVTGKDITFHVVAIDDRGAIDPTPARLHFFNNSLGNPVLRFRVYTDESEGTGEPDWKLRWVGDPSGPVAGLSPEGSIQPYVGYARRFRIDWEASSPNGAILGYRYRASQDNQQPFIPPDVSGEPRWDDTLLSFVYENEVPPEEIPGCDMGTGAGCRPEILRWPSDDYRLQVQALDIARVQSIVEDGELVFGVNYPPETAIVRDAEDPRWRLERPGGEVWEQPFAAGDTIPSGAYAIFRMDGYDRLPPAVADSFCCDTRAYPELPEVGYQGQLQMIGDEGNRIRRFQTLYSFPTPSDTIGFRVGPFQYTFNGRAVDEHVRPDLEPDTFVFHAGLRPQITELRPGSDDRVVLRDPRDGGGAPWPENTVPYLVEQDQLYWDGIQWLDTPPSEGAGPYGGFHMLVLPRFVGRPDPRDPEGNIRAWTYAMYGENDPNNSIVDGPVDNTDLYFWSDRLVENEWEFTDLEAFSIFVPNLLWDNPALFSGAAPGSEMDSIGKHLRKQLGEMTLRVQARTTRSDDRFDLHVRVREEPDLVPQEIVLGRMGRRSEIVEVHFPMLLGIAEGDPGVLTRYWPDF